MHPAKKERKYSVSANVQHYNLKLPFVVCVSSRLSVMKWLWHSISDACEDEKRMVCRWFCIVTGTSEHLFIWVSLSLTPAPACGGSEPQNKSPSFTSSPYNKPLISYNIIILPVLDSCYSHMIHRKHFLQPTCSWFNLMPQITDSDYLQVFPLKLECDSVEFKPATRTNSITHIYHPSS